MRSYETIVVVSALLVGFALGMLPSKWVLWIVRRDAQTNVHLCRLLFSFFDAQLCWLAKGRFCWIFVDLF